MRKSSNKPPGAGFYEVRELKALGLTVGTNVRISRTVRFHGVKGRIGDHVRIDDYCVITGAIELGNYIHIAPFCLLIGSGGKIILRDGSGLSSHGALYTATDDYKASVLSNPLVPNALKKLRKGAVTLGQGVIVGSHSVILPKVKIGDGASVGAQALVYKNIPAGAICVSGARHIEITGYRDAKKIKSMLLRLK